MLDFKDYLLSVVLEYAKAVIHIILETEVFRHDKKIVCDGQRFDSGYFKVSDFFS